jgi:hypothetical protein
MQMAGMQSAPVQIPMQQAPPPQVDSALDAEDLAMEIYARLVVDASISDSDDVLRNLAKHAKNAAMIFFEGE